MSVLKFCVGSRAKQPYYISSMHIRLYSMEELCYYLWENASLLDESLLTEELIRWIDEECKMDKLAKQLYEICHFDGSVHAFVSAVLTAVGFREAEEIKLLDRRIRTYEELPLPIREKSQADHLFLAGRWVAAMERYMALIEKTESQAKTLSAGDKRFLASLYHNMATVCARLFYYGAASDFYGRAYELGGEEAELKYMLVCKRMLYTPAQFEVYIRKNDVYMRMAAEAEKLMDRVNAQWMAAKDRIDLEAAAALKDTGKPEEAVRIFQEKTDGWKKEYYAYVMS